MPSRSRVTALKHQYMPYMKYTCTTSRRTEEMFGAPRQSCRGVTRRIVGTEVCFGLDDPRARDAVWCGALQYGAQQLASDHFGGPIIESNR